MIQYSWIILFLTAISSQKPSGSVTSTDGFDIWGDLAQANGSSTAYFFEFDHVTLEIHTGLSEPDIPLEFIVQIDDESKGNCYVFTWFTLCSNCIISDRPDLIVSLYRSSRFSTESPRCDISISSQKMIYFDRAYACSAGSTNYELNCGENPVDESGSFVDGYSFKMKEHILLHKCNCGFSTGHFDASVEGISCVYDADRYIFEWDQIETCRATEEGCNTGKETLGEAVISTVQDDQTIRPFGGTECWYKKFSGYNVGDNVYMSATGSCGIDNSNVNLARKYQWEYLEDTLQYRSVGALTKGKELCVSVKDVNIMRLVRLFLEDCSTAGERSQWILENGRIVNAANRNLCMVAIPGEAIKAVGCRWNPLMFSLGVKAVTKG